jgi:hypothetical protein
MCHGASRSLLRLVFGLVGRVLVNLGARGLAGDQILGLGDPFVALGAAIWVRLVMPAAFSFFSSAGPTPPMSLMSSLKSAAGLAAFLAGALVSPAFASVAASALGAGLALAGLASLTASAGAAMPAGLIVGLAPPVRISVMRTVDSNWRWPLRRR